MAIGGGMVIVGGMKGFCGPKAGSSTVGGIKVDCGAGVGVVMGLLCEGVGVEEVLAISGP